MSLTSYSVKDTPLPKGEHFPVQASVVPRLGNLDQGSEPPTRSVALGGPSKPNHWHTGSCRGGRPHGAWAGPGGASISSSPAQWRDRVS